MGGEFVVSEIVGFVDDDEVVGAPVEISKFVSVRVAGFTAEVGVGKHMVAEAILGEGTEQVARSVNGPIAPQFFRAKNEDFFVPQLKIFDDGEGGVGFAQANAIGEDTAVVALDLVDSGASAIALKDIEGLPDLGVRKSDAAQVFVDLHAFIDVAAEEFEQGFVVDELRGLVAIDLEEEIENRLFHIRDARGVVPKFVEPLVQIGAVAVPINDEVEFDVVVGGGETEPTRREIGAAHDRGRNFAASDVGHFSV